MEVRVTTDDIARKAGVNQSTVSRALRDDPRLSAATRSLIQQLGREMGYEPNSFARAMNVIRQSKRTAPQRGTLALLVPDVSRSFAPGILHSLVESARTHAGKLGYELDLVHFHAPKLSGRQLTRILKTRGISGLLVLPDFTSDRVLKRLQLDWSLFSAVTLGNALLWPALHRVSDDHFGNAKRLVRKLASLGYRRIGLCINPQLASVHANGGWEGGYYVEAQRLGDVPTQFYYETPLEIPGLHDWIIKEKLDAVITDAYHATHRIFPYGFEVPDKLGVATLMSGPGNEVSGINPNYARVWTMAVDFLVHLIHTHQRGIPQFPQRLLLEGAWIEGTTLRRVNKIR